MRFRFIVGLDPSGAYTEGKGTSGWNLFDAKTNTILDAGEIEALYYPSTMEYWYAHKALIERLVGTKRACVVMEDYLLYAAQASSQINSKFETSQLLGVLKLFCWEKEIYWKTQRASEVKRRWNDRILMNKGYLYYDRRQYYTERVTAPLSDHIRDSIRHSVHFATFYNHNDRKGKENAATD